MAVVLQLLIAGLNSILQIKSFNIYVYSKLNHSSILQVYKISLKLIKNELVNGCYKLISSFNDNNIIISILALRIFFKAMKLWLIIK